jgi:hypothetical protein
MEGIITWKGFNANFTVDTFDIVAIGGASSLLTMATLLMAAIL